MTQEKGREVITQVRNLQQELKENVGSNCVWLADEWFLIAREELPSEAEYADYPQIDNGVGSIRLFIKEFLQVAEKLLPVKVKPRKLSWVVGNAVEQAFQPIVKQLNSVEGLSVKMKALSSDYWGQDISVTGLLTGHDLLLKLQNEDLGDGILLPSVMLKHGEPIFLDDKTVEEVSNSLNVNIYPVANVEELIQACIQ